MGNWFENDHGVLWWNLGASETMMRGEVEDLIARLQEELPRLVSEEEYDAAASVAAAFSLLGAAHLSEQMRAAGVTVVREAGFVTIDFAGKMKPPARSGQLAETDEKKEKQ